MINDQIVNPMTQVMTQTVNPMAKTVNPMAKTANPMVKTANSMAKTVNPMAKMVNPMAKTVTRSSIYIFYVITVVFKLMSISRTLNGHDLPQLLQKEPIKIDIYFKRKQK